MNSMQQNEASRRQTTGAPIGKTIGQTEDEQQEASGSAGPAGSGESSPSEPAVTQSDNSLSRDAADDGRFQVAEEVSLDLQSDESRKVGHMPEDSQQVRPAEAMSEALRKDAPRHDAADEPLGKSMDRAVPPSD